MSTKNPLPFSNQFERGHSFNWAGQWTAGKYYFNDPYVTDFVSYGNAILVCRENHLASQELKPTIIYENGAAVGVISPYWEFVSSSLNPDYFQILTEEEYEELVASGRVDENTIYYTYEDD